VTGGLKFVILIPLPSFLFNHLPFVFQLSSSVLQQPTEKGKQQNENSDMEIFRSFKLPAISLISAFLTKQLKPILITYSTLGD
jgi:hypothetical protein